MYVILLGLPGAGKGTQAALLKDETGLVHVTTGELFRENILLGTDLGKQAQPFVESGRLVPDEITIGMLLDRITQPDCAGGCMLDGFPRNTEQARALDEALAADGKRIDRAVYIRVATDELVRRLAGRWSCPNCGAVYHETNEPPRVDGVCDNCGSQLTQRVDDQPDVVRTRIEVNLKNLEPLLDYYRELGKLCEANGEAGIAEVTRAVRLCLEGER
ncbi:MAG TPA: adenylate kinase [Dehalococcoidia bacterium]|nr:adenylate kinase [Dehalococcoidia bacterium]